jgi:hypothetical protein
MVVFTQTRDTLFEMDELLRPPGGSAVRFFATFLGLIAKSKKDASVEGVCRLG